MAGQNAYGYARITPVKPTTAAGLSALQQQNQAGAKLGVLPADASTMSMAPQAVPPAPTQKMIGGSTLPAHEDERRGAARMQGTVEQQMPTNLGADAGFTKLANSGLSTAELARIKLAQGGTAGGPGFGNVGNTLGSPAGAVVGGAVVPGGSVAPGSVGSGGNTLGVPNTGRAGVGDPVRLGVPQGAAGGASAGGGVTSGPGLAAPGGGLVAPGAGGFGGLAQQGGFAAPPPQAGTIATSIGASPVGQGGWDVRQRREHFRQATPAGTPVDAPLYDYERARAARSEGTPAPTGGAGLAAKVAMQQPTGSRNDATESGAAMKFGASSPGTSLANERVYGGGVEAARAAAARMGEPRRMFSTYGGGAPGTQRAEESGEGRTTPTGAPDMSGGTTTMTNAAGGVPYMGGEPTFTRAANDGWPVLPKKAGPTSGGLLDAAARAALARGATTPTPPAPKPGPTAAPTDNDLMGGGLWGRQTDFRGPDVLYSSGYASLGESPNHPGVPGLTAAPSTPLGGKGATEQIKAAGPQTPTGQTLPAEPPPPRAAATGPVAGAAEQVSSERPGGSMNGYAGLNSQGLGGAFAEPRYTSLPGAAGGGDMNRAATTATELDRQAQSAGRPIQAQQHEIMGRGVPGQKMFSTSGHGDTVSQEYYDSLVKTYKEMGYDEATARKNADAQLASHNQHIAQPNEDTSAHPPEVDVQQLDTQNYKDFYDEAIAGGATPEHADAQARKLLAASQEARKTHTAAPGPTGGGAPQGNAANDISTTPGEATAPGAAQLAHDKALAEGAGTPPPPPGAAASSETERLMNELEKLIGQGDTTAEAAKVAEAERKAGRRGIAEQTGQAMRALAERMQYGGMGGGMLAAGTAGIARGAQTAGAEVEVGAAKAQQQAKVDDLNRRAMVLSEAVRTYQGDPTLRAGLEQQLAATRQHWAEQMAANDRIHQDELIAADRNYDRERFRRETGFQMEMAKQQFERAKELALMGQDFARSMSREEREAAMAYAQAMRPQWYDYLAGIGGHAIGAAGQIGGAYAGSH